MTRKNSPSVRQRLSHRKSRAGLLPTMCALALLACSADEVLVPDLCDVRLEGVCWSQLGLDGRGVTALAMTDWGLFAGTWLRGVFRFDPSKQGWLAAGIEFPWVRAMLAVPGDNPILLVGYHRDPFQGADASVYVTEDGGKTWVPSDSGLNFSGGSLRGVYSFAMDARKPGRLYLGTSWPILRSDDGGRNWLYVSGGQDQTALGVYRLLVSSRQAGRVWAGLEDAAEQGFVRRSDDDGGTWQGYRPTPGRNVVYDVMEDSQQASRVWAVTAKGLYRSDDLGENWEQSIAGPTRVICELEGKLYVVATGERLGDSSSPPPAVFALRLYVSADRGNSWNSLPVPDGVYNAWSMISDDRGRLLIGTAGTGVWLVDPTGMVR